MSNMGLGEALKKLGIEKVITGEESQNHCNWIAIELKKAIGNKL